MLCVGWHVQACCGWVCGGLLSVWVCRGLLCVWWWLPAWVQACLLAVHVGVCASLLCVCPHRCCCCVHRGAKGVGGCEGATPTTVAVATVQPC